MQSAHDEVNLARLVRRIEKTVASETWADDSSEDSPSTPAWIRSRGTLHVRLSNQLKQKLCPTEMTVVIETEVCPEAAADSCVE